MSRVSSLCHDCDGTSILPSQCIGEYCMWQVTLVVWWRRGGEGEGRGGRRGGEGRREEGRRGGEEGSEERKEGKEKGGGGRGEERGRGS